jgi:DNA-binding response OmpR family regulator
LIQFLFCILCAVPVHTHPSERVLFGAFELDLTTGELRSTETPDPNHRVLLREQVFQVLRMLLEREGKIVTREEIKSRLWANDTVVDFDQSIKATIKALRRALGDSADNPRYIETLTAWLSIDADHRKPGTRSRRRTRRGRGGGPSSTR